MVNKASLFVTPEGHQKLFTHEENNERSLVSEDGKTFKYINGFPNLIYPETLDTKEKNALEFYENRAEVYDKFLYQTFKTHHEDEETIRNKFIDKLGIQKNSKILEIACGTGRDSELIAQRIGADGLIVLQDISPSMLSICRNKLSSSNPNIEYCLSNASFLPFPDKSFDAVYSFGGLGEFPDIRKALKEMVRVCKVGAKIVVGDEGMPPWLRDTYFYKVLSTTNPQFSAHVPLNDIPVEARKVNVEWVIGGVFYLIDFEVGDGEPYGDFDYEIEGFRGGTLRTRYEGQLEGVTRETKDLVYKAVKKKGMSLHKWLDEVAKEAAKKDLI